MTTNWIATFYDKDDNIIKTLEIKDRTEHEAEKECYNLFQDEDKISDWRLVDEHFFVDQII